MKLSVIVPVYNVEQYLTECLDSLVHQTVNDLEIILVDDGSKDRSGEICDTYAEKFPNKIRTMHIENGGQGRARNFGIECAKGEYLGFVDSDDWVTLDMYEKLLATAEEKNADVVVCDFLECYDDGRQACLPACFQEHRLSAAGSSCNKLFRRSLIGDIRFPHGLWYEDFYFSAMMLMKSKCTEFIKEPLYLYRQVSDSTMRNQNAARNLDMLKILDMLEGSMEREDLEFFVVNHVLLDTINRLSRQSAPDREQVIAEIRGYVRRKIPVLSDCKSFRAESGKRRFIMGLNYRGLHKLARCILALKAAI